MYREQLIIFLKAPRLRTVKTRLAQEIGSEAGLAAYATLVNRLIDNLSRLAIVELRFTPDDAAHEIEVWRREGWQSRPQGAGDLGVRLCAAFDKAFARGAGRVVVIGSDCPYLTATDVRLAFIALKSHDLVLGPATDGGYWLIGLGRSCPGLFARIPWSTGVVFRETLRRARLANLKVKSLRRLNDVDTVSDWTQFLAQR
jgi:rSAM/selenodomain-associated transferase 1